MRPRLYDLHDLTIKIDISLEFVEGEDRIKTIERFAGKVQKKLRKWWSSEAGQTDFILVVDAVSRKKNGKVILLTIDLTQLNMNDEIREKFKWGAPIVIRDLLNKN